MHPGRVPECFGLGVSGTPSGCGRFRVRVPGVSLHSTPGYRLASLRDANSWRRTMKLWPTVRLGEVLTPAERSESPVSGTTYRQIGVRLWGEGAYEREQMDGSATKYTQLFRAKTDDVIVNKIWAQNGSRSEERRVGEEGRARRWL